jgi:nifR3 family TIM-barrel protein
MDGITDAPYRRILAKYAKPDFLMTVLVSVDGAIRGVDKEMINFVYHDSERPIVAQLIGEDPKLFYAMAQVVCALGFDGLDINMGCSVKTALSRGAGAGLIRSPKVAQAIIREARRGIKEWAEGAAMPPEDSFPRLKRWWTEHGPAEQKIRKPIPVSVKTRLGTDKNEVESWVPALLEAGIDALTMHGRTAKQLFHGEADWDAIGQTVRLAKGSGTVIIGNGDLKSMEQARQKIKETGVDGAMVGRAAAGNPWFFKGAGYEVTLRERFKVMLEHAVIFEQVFPPAAFPGMRKHLAWYSKGFAQASVLRAALVQTHNSQEVAALLAPYIAAVPCGK